MTEDCGHRCCHIRTNGYHVHASDAPACDRCRSGVRPRVAALTDQLVSHPVGQSPTASEGASRTTSTATMSFWLWPAE
jgi:hypothetical protein